MAFNAEQVSELDNRITTIVDGRISAEAVPKIEDLARQIVSLGERVNAVLVDGQKLQDKTVELDANVTKRDAEISSKLREEFERLDVNMKKADEQQEKMKAFIEEQQRVINASTAMAQAQIEAMRTG